MFYNIIKRKVDMWIDSDKCKIKDLLSYIETKGKLRDTQIEAIKTYLFLKIEGQNKSLVKLFTEGFFNGNIDLEKYEMTSSLRNVLSKNPSARALYELSIFSEDNTFSGLEKEIKQNFEKINYAQVFSNLFYNTTYTDYIFSLPMGAGKTYLMAMFIYIDLYFSINDCNNKAFASNFILFAPSGLKSSVVPSLKTVKEFDPSWIIPEPSATNIKNIIKFELLDQVKSDKKSNKAKNPNVSKISNHQPFDTVKGLVIVTNAEKVILDRIKENHGQVDFFDNSNDILDKEANELRNLIGKIPNLAIFLDEVHHVVSEDIKLRQVVNKWNENNTINSIIGFSGTPYLTKAEEIKVSKEFSFKSKILTNVVYYYPLVKGVGNFLKRPVIKISNDNNSINIIEDGLKDFLNNYREITYPEKVTSKIAIYCSNIDNLEKNVYPKVCEILKNYNMDANEVVLKYYGDNKDYKLPVQNKTDFISLDRPTSKKRIILLVQIGKEGWDCKSLTSIILSNKNDCPTNMVLQTSCRCLRQVENGKKETALIWLNDSNAKILNNQLKEQQNTNIKELQNGIEAKESITRISRIEKLKLSPISFIELKLNYETVLEDTLTEEIIKNNLKQIIRDIRDKEKVKIEYKKILTKTTTNIEQNNGTIEIIEEVGNENANYIKWKLDIIKGSMGNLCLSELNKFNRELNNIFNVICYKKENINYYNNLYDVELIKSKIRQSFYSQRKLNIVEENISNNANILKIENINKPLYNYKKDLLYPKELEVKEILEYDEGKKIDWDNIDPETFTKDQLFEMFKNKKSNIDTNNIKYREKTFHYIPYYFGQSEFEMNFLESVIDSYEFQNNQLEIYYNGDNSLTDFRIRCYKKVEKKLKSVGLYTPDFIIIKRENNEINKILIVETKGSGYKEQSEFIDRRDYMKKDFLKLNNSNFGYDKFDYLYIEDTLTDNQIKSKLKESISKFFKEVK